MPALAARLRELPSLAYIPSLPPPPQIHSGSCNVLSCTSSQWGNSLDRAAHQIPICVNLSVMGHCLFLPSALIPGKLFIFCSSETEPGEECGGAYANPLYITLFQIGPSDLLWFITITFLIFHLFSEHPEAWRAIQIILGSKSLKCTYYTRWKNSNLENTVCDT